MDENRVAFQAMMALLFIALSLVNGKPLKSSHNKTGGYTPVMQNIRPLTVGRNPLHEIIDWNNNNFNHFNNFSNVSPKKEINSESNSDSNPEYSDSREWSLQFDPNYFASLNAANHRPIDAMITSPTDSQSKVSSSSSANSSPSSQADNMYYYSPETYGKTSHKNHKTGSFAYSYPSTTSTSSTTTTTTSTTPSPKTSNNRFGDYSSGSPSNEYSQPAPQPFSTSYNNNEKHYNYDESADEEEEPNYYDPGPNEEIGRKVYYPVRNKHKPYSLHDYYGSDLSSMSTSNEDSKIKAAVNTPVASYGAQEEVAHNIESYESGGNVRFPSKYYGSGGSGAYYPSYYPSPYYGSASEHSSSGMSGIGDSLLHKSSGWIGPGIAGLLLGILPLGILMASMVPAFMSVPIVSTATVGRRKRDLSDVGIFGFNDTKLFLNPGVFSIIARYGMSSLQEPQCLKEMFCTFGAEGKHSKDSSQSILFDIIDWTPDTWAKYLGLDTLFHAIKYNKCQKTYQCLTRKVKLKETEKYN